MTYTLNTTIFANTFAVPSVVADKYLKIATESQLKVLLYFMRNISEGINAAKIASVLSISADEVEDALIFWSQCDILVSKQPKAPDTKQVIINSALPSRADVIKRGLEDENLMFLLREAQLKFGRNLKQNESQLLVALYDDYGMEISVILFLLGYAAREGKCNLAFVKKTATDWMEHGVETVIDAERIIAESAKQNLAWGIVQNAFGIESRKPSTKELEYSNLWVNEWRISTELLKSAYDACIDSKTKLSIPYIAKIIESWHKEGITSSDDVKLKTKPAATKRVNDYGGYDLDKYEQMLENKLKEKGQ